MGSDKQPRLSKIRKSAKMNLRKSEIHEEWIDGERQADQQEASSGLGDSGADDVSLASRESI